MKVSWHPLPGRLNEACVCGLIKEGAEERRRHLTFAVC